MKSTELKNKVMEILKDNVFFAPQVGEYVVHGAIDKIHELYSKQNDVVVDPFIQKHLDIIWEKTRESAIKRFIEPMFDNLTAESIKYFLKTGTVNGGFLIALMEMMDSIKNWKSKDNDVSDMGVYENFVKATAVNDVAGDENLVAGKSSPDEADRKS